MPLPIQKIPELSDNAAGELIPANQQLSKSRGQLNLWVLRVSLFIMIVLAGVIWFMYKAERDENKAQHEQDQMTIMFWKTDSKNWQDKYINSLIEKQYKLDNLQDTTKILKQQLAK